MKPTIVYGLAALCALAGCKSKLDKCNHVCDELQAESVAKCSDDACRREAKEAHGACNDLCWTVAGGNTAAKPKLASTEDACHAGTAAACEDLAGMYLLGRGVPKDDAKAAQYFQAACNGGVALSCEMIGKMYRDVRGVARDEARGYQLLTKACDGKDKLGCMGVGGLYLNGNGVRRDVKRAKELLTKACSLGAQPACDKVRAL